VFTDYAENSKNRMNNLPNTLLGIIHTFLHHSSIGALSNVQTLIKSVYPIQTLRQLYFLCRIVGPFAYRLAAIHKCALFGEVYFLDSA
jgi:hypothetical protein